MLRAIGFNVAICWDIVLQTGLYKEADLICDVELQTNTKGCGELPWSIDAALSATLVLIIQIVVSLKG
mgnify:CR=1 FL=1